MFTNNQHALSIQAANSKIAAFFKKQEKPATLSKLAAMVSQQTVNVATAPSKPAPKKVEGEKRVTNSQRVRDRIAEAKLNNEAPEVVIGWAMSTLGQPRALATRYVVENWNRNTTPARGECKLTVGVSTRGVMPRQVTKAQQVRERIAIAKTNGETQDAVVEWTMTNLAMSKSQAKQYVTNNWERA